MGREMRKKGGGREVGQKIQNVSIAFLDDFRWHQ
jgi:hypothetical protein